MLVAPRRRAWRGWPGAGGVVTGRTELPGRLLGRGRPAPPEMCCGRQRWSLGSLLLLLGRSLGLLVETPRDVVNGTVGHSVLLPVSYRFGGVPHPPLSIYWKFPNSSHKAITCTISNCALDAGGARSNCTVQHFSSATYRGRAELFCENGSLLLRDLQLRDSGKYCVTFSLLSQPRAISLAVHEQRVTPQDPGDAVDQHHILYCAIGISSSVSLLLLFLLISYLRHRGAARRQKRRITKQQAPLAEECPMEGSAANDIATIYIRVGDSLEQPRPGPGPEVVYCSITRPGAP